MVNPTLNICLVHGWGASINKLEPLAEALSALGWKAKILPLPFFDKPEPETFWSLQDFASYAQEFCQKEFASQPYFLFGHSLGGRISIKLAASGGQSSVQGLALCATAGVSRPHFFKRSVFKLLSVTFRPITARFQLLRKIVYRLAGSSDYLQISSPVKKITFQKIVAEDLKPVLVKIKVPVLILWGKQDKTTPVKDAHLLRKTISKSVLKIYPKEDHRLPYNQPVKLAQEINRWRTNL